jgi:hypothetical protein
VLERLRTNFRFDKEFRKGGSVEVFGSSTALLATPSSDVDLCLRLPAFARDMDQRREALDQARVLPAGREKEEGKGAERNRSSCDTCDSLTLYAGARGCLIGCPSDPGGAAPEPAGPRQRHRQEAGQGHAGAAAGRHENGQGDRGKRQDASDGVRQELR